VADYTRNTTALVSVLDPLLVAPLPFEDGASDLYSRFDERSEGERVIGASVSLF
jgi:hypothetical protein